jgi:hypothetical protein
LLAGTASGWASWATKDETETANPQRNNDANPSFIGP